MPLPRSQIDERLGSDLLDADVRLLASCLGGAPVKQRAPWSPIGVPWSGSLSKHQLESEDLAPTDSAKALNVMLDACLEDEKPFALVVLLLALKSFCIKSGSLVLEVSCLFSWKAGYPKPFFDRGKLGDHFNIEDRWLVRLDELMRRLDAIPEASPEEGAPH